MITRQVFFTTVSAALLTTAVVSGQSSTPAAAPYKPGVTFQTTNPNYPTPNPFYFEGRIDWNLLKIDQPSNAWEFAQRGIHRQDELEDISGAIEDYRKAILMNSIGTTCQIITFTPAENFGKSLTVPPCMFTVRSRLGRLLIKRNPKEALGLFAEVLAIDPLRLGIHSLSGETYVTMAEEASDPSEEKALLQDAISEYQKELDLSPVNTPLTTDEANNAHVHWALAEIYGKLGAPADEAKELDLYLKATKWHSDTYAWRIPLAQKRIEKLTSVNLRGSSKKRQASH